MNRDFIPGSPRPRTAPALMLFPVAAVAFLPIPGRSAEREFLSGYVGSCRRRKKIAQTPISVDRKYAVFLRYLKAALFPKHRPGRRCSIEDYPATRPPTLASGSRG